MSHEPIVSRTAIHLSADQAAQMTVRTGIPHPNPFPEGSQAHREWKECYEQQLKRHSAGRVEA